MVSDCGGSGEEFGAAGPRFCFTRPRPPMLLGRRRLGEEVKALLTSLRLTSLRNSNTRLPNSETWECGQKVVNGGSAKVSMIRVS